MGNGKKAAKVQKAAERAAQPAAEAVARPPVKRKRPTSPSAFDSRRARLAGMTGQLIKSDEERTEHARMMGRARWAKYRDERVARGLPPTKTQPPAVSPNDLAEWLELVDSTWPHERLTNDARRKRAMMLMRRAIAEDELKYSSRDEVAGNDA